MSKLEQKLREDRTLRDAAKAVLLADIEHTKASFSVGGITGRVGERIGDGAKDVFEVAKTQADDNRGILAALVGAILLWLGREPLLDLLGFSDEDENEDAASDNGIQPADNHDAQMTPDETGSPDADDDIPGDDHEH